MNKPRSGRQLILFIYRAKGASCHPATIHDKLHGYSEIRIKKDEHGRTQRKTYYYPGIPHQDLIPSTALVEAKEEAHLEEIFQRFKVSYVKIVVKSIKFMRWVPQPHREKPP